MLDKLPAQGSRQPRAPAAGSVTPPARVALRGADADGPPGAAPQSMLQVPAARWAGGPAPLTQGERERALAHGAWDRARVGELSAEIERLLDGSGAAAPPAPGAQGGASRAPGARRADVASVLSGRDLSQPLNLYRVPDGIMQVFVIGLHQSSPINRPYVVVRLGDQTFQTSVSKSPTGDWNEGFEVIVSYHTQLFGTVHMDVYSSNTLLPDTLVGRAEIKISLLGGFPEVFTSYYEIWDKNLAASTVPDQRQRSVVSRNLGALQVRVNYRFQKADDPEPAVTRVHGAHLAGALTTRQAGAAAVRGGGTSGPAAMSTDELVAVLASRYGQCCDTAHRHGGSASARGAAGASCADPGLGFARIDDDAVPPDAGAAAQDPGAKGGPGGAGWFFDLFAGPQEPASASAATPAPAPAPAPTPTGTAGPQGAGPAAEKTLMQSLAGMFVSSSTFMVLKSLERLVGLFNQGVELSNTELLGGLLALYRFHGEADIPGVSRPHPGPPVEGVQALEQPGRFARFALASYGWRALYFFNRGITLMDGAKVDSDVTSVLQYLRLAKEDLLGYEFRSAQLFCPSYFVAHDRRSSAVVLVVRGTMSAEDAVVDLACEYTKWSGGLVHSGIKASAHWLFAEVMPQILAYATSHAVPAIRIVGHSLGGSTAAILTIMLREARGQLAALGVDLDRYDIQCYCYGPAPCVSDTIADRHRDCIHTYVNRDDLVPRLCYGSVSDFRRMSISAADEADNLGQLLYSPFENSAQQQQRWKDRFARLMAIREEILASEENMHLALPGTIYHIVHSPDPAAATAKAPPQDRRLAVAVARRRLFGAGSVGPETDAPSTSESDTDQQQRLPPLPPPPPPSTPATIVQQDAVDADDIADAINTPISGEAATDPPLSVPGPAPDPAKGAGSPGDGKFVPVWVQQVPSHVFREIILRSTIITDHMPSAYELAFAHAAETQVLERPLRARHPPA